MNADAVTQSKHCNVLVMPDYRADNPYQSLLAKSLELSGVSVHFAKGYRRVLPIFRAVKNSQPSVDIFHLHWLAPYTKGENALTKCIYICKFLIDILMVRWSGVKIIWTVHNRIPHNSKFPNLELWTRRMLVKLVDRIILHNHSYLQEILDEYQCDRSMAEVIPHGNYRDIYNKAINPITARQELGLPLTGRIYLNQGMLRPYKGLEHLLKVWGDRSYALAGDTLIIAGKPLDEAYGKQLQNLAATISGVYIYPQFIPDDQMYLFFSAADIAILPFESILTSGSLVLAMSYSKPIIAPKLGGIVETLGAADWLLYNPEEEQGLLQAIEKSTQIDLSELSQLTTQACDQLDWQQIGQKTVKIYGI